MSISSVQNVSFKGCRCGNCRNKTGGMLPAFCSIPVSGLGQLIDGRGRKGAKFFLATYGSYAMATALNVLNLVAKEKGSKIGAVATYTGSLVALATGLLTHVKSVIDGYNGERCEDTIDIEE